MRRTTWGLLALVGYLVLIAFGRIGDRLILFPSRAPLDSNGAGRRTIPFAEGALEIWTARSDDAPPEKFVLRFYGNADRADRWVASEAKSFAGRHVEVWGVNYPGYGGSSGHATLEGVGRSAIAAFDALEHEAAGRPIFVFGTSLGTTAAFAIAAERKPRGLMLQNPPALKQLIVGDHGWWNLWALAAPVAWSIPALLDSVANAKKSRCPALLLLAEADEVVRPKYQQLVAAAYAGEKTILVQPGARHNTPMDPAFARRYREALATLMGD